MKLKGASGYACVVTDLDKTAEFYQKLGLEIKSKSADRLVIYLNWYRIDLFTVGAGDSPSLQAEASLGDKGSGVYLYFSVDDVDETYRELSAQGLEPDAEPRDEPWGNREFIVRDPDGYKLVFFKRKARNNPLN